MVKDVEQFLHFSAVPYPWPFNCGCPNMTSHVKAVVLHNWYQMSPPAVSSSFKTFVTQPNAIHNSKWGSGRVYSLQKHVSVSWWYEAWGFLLLQFTFSKLCQSWRLMNISRRFSSPQLHLNLLIDIGYMHSFGWTKSNRWGVPTWICQWRALSPDVVEAHSSNKTYYDLESILVFSNFINPVQNNQSAICEKDREVEREITIGVDSSKMTVN